MATPNAGRTGRLYMDTSTAGTSTNAVQVALISNWSLDKSADEFDGTSFGDTTKVKIPGLPNADVSFKGWFDPTSPGIAGLIGDQVTSRRFYLYTTNSATSYFFGTGAVNGSLEVDVNGLETVTGKISNSTPVYFQA